MSNNAIAKSRGFTLIEVVIALAITAVIMTFSYQSFHTASQSTEAGKKVMASINALDRTWQILGQDLRNLQPPIMAQHELNVPGGVRQRFEAATVYGDSSEKQRVLRFTRGGWLNPMGRLRSDLQQVVYHLEDGTLWRDYRPDRNIPLVDWQFTDNLLKQKMLSGISKIQLKFLPKTLAKQQGSSLLDGEDYARDWPDHWPASDSPGPQLALPVAVLVKITLESGLTGERLYEIAR